MYIKHAKKHVAELKKILIDKYMYMYMWTIKIKVKFYSHLFQKSNTKM